MVNAILSIPGYVHLYRSLLRFYDMPENEVREMLYLLNTANLNCYEYYHPGGRWSRADRWPLAAGWKQRLPPLPDGSTALQVSLMPEAEH